MLKSIREANEKYIEPIVSAGWAVILLTMTLHVVSNGLLRKFLRAPIDGTNEITQYWYMPLIAFGGFIITELRNEHIEARIIYDRMPPRVQQEYQIGARILFVISSAAFAIYGLVEALEALSLGLTGGVINLPIWPVTFGAPIAFGAMFVIGVSRLISEVHLRLSTLVPDEPASKCETASAENDEE